MNSTVCKCMNMKKLSIQFIWTSLFTVEHSINVKRFGFIILNYHKGNVNMCIF